MVTSLPTDVDEKRHLASGAFRGGDGNNPENADLRDTGALVSSLHRNPDVIYHHDGEGQRAPHLPPWRLGICLDCQHCFDAVEHERCTACESRRFATLDMILQNWNEFGKVLSPA